MTQTVKLLTVNIRRLASVGEASAMSKSDRLLARLHNVALGSNNNGRLKLSMLPTNPPRTPELMRNRDHIQSAVRSASILNRVDDARAGKKQNDYSQDE
jgi:hypothetical protein